VEGRLGILQKCAYKNSPDKSLSTDYGWATLSRASGSSDHRHRGAAGARCHAVDLEEAGVIGLKAAHSRGVDVEVIVNRISARQYKSGSRYSAATYLTNAG